MRITHRLAGVALAILCVGSCSDSQRTSTSPDTPLNPNVDGVVVSMVGFAVEGATVEVTSGAKTGVSAVTDAGGRFSLAGVQGAGGVTLKVRKAGYDEGIFGNTFDTRPDRPVQLVIYPISLDPATTRFTVSLAADPACSMLPDDVRSRTYRADMGVSKRADGADFQLPLEGADFFPNQRVIWGIVQAFGRNATFYVSSAEAAQRWLEDDPIVEHLGGSRYLAVMGLGAVEQPATPGQTVTVPFNGTFSYCANGGGDAFFACNAIPVECKSASHRLTLTPR